LERLWREGGFCNRVVMVKVPEYELPFKTIPNQVRVHPVNDMIISVTFRRMVDKHKIWMPVKIVGEKENPALAAGNILNRPAPLVPCFWNGGDYIPEAIVVDVSKLPLHGAIHAHNFPLPEGLTLAEPKKTWCLASIRPPKKEE